MPDHNPFTLTFGKIPYTYISRQDSVSTILDEYTAAEPTRQIFRSQVYVAAEKRF